MGAAATLVTVEEYLTTAYSPDVDYVDGELQERNMGEGQHSAVQKFFIAYLAAREDEWNIVVYPEQRLQTTATRYRVPDIAVVAGDAPFESILRSAPLLCIEVLSPEDRMSRVLRKVAEYVALGVRSVWIIDPWERQISFAEGSVTLQSAGQELSVPGTAIRVPVVQVFQQLDRLTRRSRE